MTLTGHIVGTKGNTGRGIASIVENADYTITINLTDGTSYTTAPIAGFTDVAFDENYDLVVTKTDGTQITVETDLDTYETLLAGYKADAETAESHASGYATAASGSANTATAQATLARSYAKGDTSSRTGETTDNADYYRGLAANSATSASGFADSASASASTSGTQALKSEGFAVGEQSGVAVSSGSTYYHNNSKYYSQLASASETSATSSASSANADALKAEGYAVGKQNGTTQTSGTYYHNNAQYYNSQATNMASLATNKANSAGTDALKAEGFSVGEQNGTPVTSDSDYYENNAKYYADEAQGYAESIDPDTLAKLEDISELLPTETASGDIASFNDGQAVIPAVSVVATITPIQSGSGTPSPSNVRPISGYDDVEVDVVGKNIFDESVLLQAYGWTENDGVYSGSPAQLFNKFGSNPIPLKCAENTSYTLSVKFRSTNGLKTWVRFDYSDGTRNTVSGDSTTETKLTLTSNQTKTVVGVSFSYSDTDTIYLSEFQVELGTTATAYEPYNGTTHTTTLPSTTYGGTLDVVSGALTVTHGIVDLGTLSWSYNSSLAVFYADLTTMKRPCPLLCTKYSQDFSSNIEFAEDKTIWNQSFAFFSANICIKDSAYTSSDTFKQAMSGVMLCYELVTPQTYQLTPQQIDTLKGQNNITATSGQVSVTYKADIQKYIDNAVGTKEEDMVANNAITSGSLFSVNDRLYKATATIAVGETIKVGVNCTETSIIEQLNSLITLI